MILSEFKLLMIILILHVSAGSRTEFRFPKKFLIGSASAAYQIEGAWNVSGKSISNWDHYVHTKPNPIDDGTNGDVATDFYYKYAEDMEILQKIGLQHYRFSLSWPRILPSGYKNHINEAGIRHYHKVLDELEKRDIMPVVTIYHWDHPQSLEDEFGGWLNEKMAYLFADYARIVFKEFGNRVKYFVTLNEMSQFCTSAYKEGTYPPALNLTGLGEYQCVHNMLKAHALAYHIYNKEFRENQKGLLSISIPVTYSFTTEKGDQESADISFEFNCGWLANPIFSKEGDYPEIMKKRIAERSKLQGYNSSRLPTFSQEWIELLRGSADYFGLNHYSSDIVTPLPLSKILEWPDDQGLKHSYDPNWATAQTPWLKVVPEGFGDLLRLIKRKYGNPPVFVLENGIPDGNRTDDKMRTNYMYSYMREMMIAMQDDGCDVRAYTIWSFTDSFEWKYGYVPRFGLVQIDFDDKTRKRTIKNSVSWLESVLAARELKSPHRSNNS